MSQQALADRVDLDRAAITRIEGAERRVTVEELLDLAAALSVSPMSLALPREDEGWIAIAGAAVAPIQARRWWRGWTPPTGSRVVAAEGKKLPKPINVPAFDTDERRFFASAPDREYRALIEPVTRELLGFLEDMFEVLGHEDDEDAMLSEQAAMFDELARAAAQRAEQLERRRNRRGGRS